MNKITCKLTALLLTLTFLMSMVCVSVSAETATKISTTGVTRLEGEAATEIVGGGYSRNMKTDDGAYALSYSPVAVTSGQEYYARFVVDVEVPGKYGISAVASIRSQTYTSDWTIYANTTDNAATAYTQGADVTTGWYSGNFKQFNCGTINLNAGQNTIYWKVNAADAISGNLQAALDYIELTPPPVTVVSSSVATRIEGEAHTEVLGGGYKRDMKTDDGAYALTYSPIAPVSGQEYYATYYVNVELPGNYNINTVASIKGQTHTTDWTIYANTTDNAVTGYTKGADVTTGWFSGVFKEYNCGTIYLKSGINTIYWKVNEADAASNQLQAALDYIELTPPPVDVISAAGTTRLEGETATEIIGGGYSRNMKTDDGAYALSYSPVAVTEGQEYYAAFYVNVEVAGNYKVNTVASVKGQTYTSDWTIYANTADNAVTGYTQGADVTTGWYSGNFKQYNCGTIYLKEGLNTIYWKVNEADAVSGNLQAALDYIELTSPVVQISPTASTRIEGEAATEVLGGGYSRSMLTDGSRKALTYSPNAPVAGQEYYATYVVNVELPGTYNINVVASKRSETYTSDWTIYANTADNAVSGYTKGADVTTNWFSGVFNEYNCGTITLKKGINTIYWKVNEADAASNQLQAALDYIELTPPPIVEISAVGTTRIEGEAASEKVGGGYSRSMLSDGSRKALTYASVAATSGQEYYAAYYVNVEEAGYYKVNAVASVKGQTYTSDWTIYANTADNAVTGYTQGTTVTTDWYSNNFKEFSCGTIYLEKGLNTIYWKVDGNDAPSGILQAALDYIEFTSQVIQVPAVGTTRIEGEAASTIIGGGYKRNMSTSDGAYALTYSPVAVTEGQEYYSEYDINVEEAGYYKVNAVASVRGQTYTSDWTIYANTADNTVTGYTQGADVTTGWYSGNFKQFNCGTIYLNAGRNKLYWKVNGADAASGVLQAALDYIELTSAVIRVSATETTKVEGEAYTSSTVTPNIRVMNNPDDGQRAVNYVSYTPENYDGKDFIIEFDMYVEQSGYYKLDAVASLREQEYTSDWFFYMNTEDNGFAYIQGEDVETTSFLKNLFKQYHCEKIYLNQGSNKLYWKVDKADAPSGKLQAALDYFTLTPFVPQVIEIGDETAFEAETDMIGTVAIGASNDRIVAGVSAKVTNSISLNVLTEGNYMVEISGTSGKVSVAFDDNEAVTLGDSEAIKTADGASFVEGKYPYDTYVLAESVGLTAGSHTVTITVDGDSDGAAADYIKLTRMVEPTGISISADDVLNIGDTTDITVNGINIADMYMVTYSTSDDYVAIVDGNGKVTATGAGTAYIDVVVRKYVISEGITMSLEVEVNTDDALYIRNAQVNDGVFTADLTKVRTLGDVAKAYITVYEKGVLKYISVVDVEDGIGLQAIAEEVPGATEGDVVEIFVWYSNMEAVCDPVCVRVK